MISDAIYNLVLYNYSIKRLARAFLKNGFLVKSLPYRMLYEDRIRQSVKRFSALPFRVMIENTNICNADCTFCPHKAMRRPSGVMDMALFKKIIDDCSSSGVDYVTIYGFGEPLMDRLFFERVRYAKEKGIKRVTTNTNAFYLDEEKIDLLIKSGIDEVYVSFDAFSAATFKKIRPNLDFNKVRQNILGLLAKRAEAGSSRPQVVLSFVESPLNSKEVSLYLRYWKGRADFVSISIAHNWTGQIKDKNLQGAALRDPCRLLWTDMFILYNGDVALCCNDYEGRVIIGNIKNRSIKDIWGGDILAKLREVHLRKNFSALGLCEKCNYNFHYKSNWWVSR